MLFKQKVNYILLLIFLMGANYSHTLEENENLMKIEQKSMLLKWSKHLLIFINMEFCIEI
jgi:phage-related holin